MTTLAPAADPPAETPADVPRAGLAVAALSLARREWVRFLRQRNRVIGALLTPVLFWLLLGGGMGDSFRAPATGEPFLTYFFPGMLLMVVVFTAIFTTMSLIEDRREGFLQGVLVAPVPRAAVVSGKVLGGATLAGAQAVLLLALGPASGHAFEIWGYLVAGLFLLGLSVAVVSLGVCLAWPMTSTQGYHVAMNLLLMPMWFLSGSVFPPAGAAGPVQWLAWANPLTYGLAGVRQGLHGGAIEGLPGVWVCAAVTVGTAGALLGAACFVARRPVAADVES